MLNATDLTGTGQVLKLKVLAAVTCLACQGKIIKCQAVGWGG